MRIDGDMYVVEDPHHDIYLQDLDAIRLVHTGLLDINMYLNADAIGDLHSHLVGYAIRDASLVLHADFIVNPDLRG